MDRVTRRRGGGVIERLLHDAGGEPVVVRVAQTAPETVLFGARARSREAAAHGIARMRFALAVDDDLRDFYKRFERDPLIGRSLRERPWLRVSRRPEPFEALVWAVCEQLIEYERAAAIQNRLVTRLGRRWTGAGATSAVAPGTRGQRAQGRKAPGQRAPGPADGERDYATCRRPRRSARPPPRCCSRATSRPAGQSRCGAPRARWRRGASTCTTQAPSAAGGGCGRSGGSARGRWR